MDGLTALVEQTMPVSALSGSLFVFINRRKDKLKVLFWERNGFVVWYKRLEAERFPWPRRREQAVLTLNGQQLNWLLDGYDAWRMTPHRTLHYRVLS